MEWEKYQQDKMIIMLHDVCIFQLIAVDLSKWKALDADPRAFKQIVFQGVVGGADNTKEQQPFCK